MNPVRKLSSTFIINSTFSAAVRRRLSTKSGNDGWNDAWEAAWLPDDLSGKNRAPWEVDVNFALSDDTSNATSKLSLLSDDTNNTTKNIQIESRVPEVDTETKAFVEDMNENWHLRKGKQQKNGGEGININENESSLYSLENIKRDYRLKKQRVHAGLWLKEIEKMEETELGDSIGGSGNADDIERLLDSCSEIFDSPNDDSSNSNTTSEFKNKPDGWETTSKTQDGNIWEMSQREEDILVQEFERRIAFNKFQPLYLYEVEVRSAYTLPSPNPTCGIPLDPKKRIPIRDYHPDERDEIRRAYIQRGPHQPRIREFPQSDLFGLKRRFNRKWFKNIMIGWSIVWMKMQLIVCVVIYFKMKAFIKVEVKHFQWEVLLNVWMNFENLKQKVQVALDMGEVESAITNELNESLQKKEQDIANAILLVKVVKKRLQDLRNEGWDSLIENVSAFCVKYDILIPNFDEFYVNFGGSRRKVLEYTISHHYRVEVFLRLLIGVLQELNDRFNEIASFIKTHIFSRRRPIDGWKYMIEEIGPNARKGKGSVSRLPSIADASTRPFREEDTSSHTTFPSNRGRTERR
ncbi:hypothetical protein H5410_034088 [Solanum commersonii]|uniref:Uncharacterized protein n=1 Tax=Solanum commersonii TaxID=4109 RepID=A0A9J5YV08_SOLCO|nr:hypothetical protein H5410_034088 [Solanum commersonii]